MNRPRPETWSRVAETALLSLVFLAPLAAHGRTWDPSALRIALLQAAALTLGAAWILKGLARGRWEFASGAWTALAPVLALAAWALAVFAAAPYKTAALPELISALSPWAVFAVALLEFGGARHAARLSFWTAAAAALVFAAAAVQHFGVGPGVGGTLADGAQLAAFAAAALPAALALRLDPEAPDAARALSLATALALALAAGWSASAGGLAAFILSAAIFSAATAALLRGDAAREARLIALASAVLAAVVGGVALHAAGVSWEPSFSRPALPVSGAVGAALLAWAALAAAEGGLRAAWDLRRRGAPAEAGYAAAFASGFAAWGLAAAAGLTPFSGPGAWLSWAAAGIAAGMLPLTRARGLVRVLPVACGEDVRRLMSGSVLVACVGLAAWPGLWLASDVSYNRAVAESRAQNLDAALADAGRVWPGSAVYAPALYLRGRVLADQGKPQEALDAYARLDGVAPDYGRVHARRAEAYAALGDWPSSAQERARQDVLTPEDADNLVGWAEAARASGDLDAARRAAARAAALAPDDEGVKTQLAANALMERKLAAQESARRRAGRKGLAFKPKSR